MNQQTQTLLKWFFWPHDITELFYKSIGCCIKKKFRATLCCPTVKQQNRPKRHITILFSRPYYSFWLARLAFLIPRRFMCLPLRVKLIQFRGSAKWVSSLNWVSIDLTTNPTLTDPASYRSDEWLKGASDEWLKDALVRVSVCFGGGWWQVFSLNKCKNRKKTTLSMCN